jgi:hypothetical protein
MPTHVCTDKLVFGIEFSGRAYHTQSPGVTQKLKQLKVFSLFVFLDYLITDINNSTDVYCYAFLVY